MVYNNTPGDKIFVSWSGGKDSYLSLLLAKGWGLDPACLLSFVGSDGHSRSHGLKTEVLRHQASMLGIPLEMKKVSWESYEQGFEEAVNRIKAEYGLTGGVFGDINLEEHRQWVEKMCRRCGISYNLPLWMKEERRVSEELIRRGGKAVVVAVRSDLVDQSWLGRLMDDQYIDYCLSKKISPCGEGGEVHTLVIDGPLFKKPLQFRLGEIKHGQDRSLLEVIPVYPGLPDL